MTFKNQYNLSYQQAKKEKLHDHSNIYRWHTSVPIHNKNPQQNMDRGLSCLLNNIYKNPKANIFNAEKLEAFPPQLRAR